MMKLKKLLAVLICILILSGCKTPKAENKDLQLSANISPNLSTEEGIRDYLAGEWIFNNEYGTDVACKMSIDNNLNIKLLFYDTNTDQSKGNFTGKIKFDRAYANPNESPDLLSIELTDTDYPGGDFFFKHRTIYNKKRVMSWFFAGNGNSVFDMLGPEGFESTPEEIVFEKVSGETSQLRPRKNDEFYAVYWGKGANKGSLWLDDVKWTPSEGDESARLYPECMTYYENDAAESIIYSIVADQISEILGDDLFPGAVYFVKTNEHGNIVKFVGAEYKKWIEDGCITPDDREMVLDFIQHDVPEIKEYLNLGMMIQFDGETIMVDGEEYYYVVLGTQHEDHFVGEIHYAVDAFTRQVYENDIVNDVWVPVAVD